MKKIWIVGGSSGIGLELVKILLINGYKVIVSSRNATSNDDLHELIEKYENTLKLYDLDVSSNKNLTNDIENIFKLFDGIDIWFYNAGAYEVMGIDDWNVDYFKQMNEVNYMGAVKIMNYALPLFRKQGYGKWVWNLSLVSIFGLPKGGGYSAPKAALLNLAQSLKPELESVNIQLQVINHGFVKTRLTSKNKFDMPQLMEPEFAANEIYYRMISSDRFEIFFPFALSAFLKFLDHVPYGLSMWLTKKMLKDN